ncbi:hypothetical protein ACLEJQ_08970 [Pseudomonas sp. SMV71]|uniref:hypothetical protein n=1 Tax=Pseudomonas sp. SMV71 TaxID=3390195 RepID=UPI003F84424D
MSGNENAAVKVLVIGRGRFARTLLAHLCGVLDEGAQIVQCYRDARLASSAGNAFAAPHVRQAPMHTLLGEEGLANLQALMVSFKPDVIVSAASAYSPYGSGPGAGAPFGSTLPLQLPIATNVARAAHSCGNDGLLLNACYPELVNPVARLLGTPFDAGLGNAQTLNWAQDFGAQGDRFQALAHHSHLGKNPRKIPLMYDATNGLIHEPLAACIEALDRRRALSREERNDIGATAAASLIAELAMSPSVNACLPGVGVETGAMPVSLGLGRAAKPCIKLSGADLNQVRARHRQECMAEGWDIFDDVLELSSDARAGMGMMAPPDNRLNGTDLGTWVSSLEGLL